MERDDRRAGTPENQAWADMKQRCFNPRNHLFKYFGARGIGVCDRWRGDVRAFIADVGLRPSSGHRLELLDRGRGYEPGNVAWVEWRTRATFAWKSDEYRTWCQMKQRCTNPADPGFARYGGRGIKVCARWSGERGFENFLADVGPRPEGRNGKRPEYTIDRKDNDGNYEPGNVRWATKSRQARNTSRTVFYTLNGETLSRSDWAERLGMKWKTLHCRIDVYGWSVERALTTPVQKRDRVY